MSWLLIAIFAMLALAGIPLAVSLGLAAVFVLYIYGFSLSIVPQAMYTSMNTFILVAVPLFILAGNLMERGGMSERIFDFASSIVGRWRGGVGHVNVVASTIFGGISGSSVADVASLGPLEIKAMTERGYPKPYAASLVMVTSTLASMIPPSILLIVAAATAQESVAAALAGGLGPGIMLAALFMLANYIISVRRGYGEVMSFGLRQSIRMFLVAIPALVTPVVILTGIFGGFITPTEAAGVAVVYTAFVSALFYGDLRWNDLPGILIRTARTSGTILLIAMSASIATYVFTVDGLPAQVSSGLLAISENPVVIMLMIGVILVVLGMFMDIIAAIFLLVPILTPAAVMVGIDPIHFLVFLVMALALGLTTPPVGICLFAASYVSGISIERLTRETVPFYLTLVVQLLLVALIPVITLGPVNLFNL
ncbi:TRAP transporter large permease [Rubrobacter taiwanensis]|uniref:TRAP transporter large permease n=1 Tax=Rubrobacter taiwanensis TaxID=185139 RepID=A0A4R1BSS4_9ACTN|nr:TRAP transporter large permease [Rubrobacter taiwanensis]TCJ20731.1 TRAP transporter large permease [Rubrobacter taiwanensis]